MTDRSQVQQAIDAGGGVLRLEPCWVPRSFMIPGRRLRLHPDDYYACGGHRGGINERWFSSTTNADNGPGTPADEGLSYVRLADGTGFLLKDAVEQAGDLLLGGDVMQREKGWNLLCKFFDNLGPIPHHMHQNDADAKRVGRRGKPEAYYFSSAVQSDRQQLSLHVHGARARNDQGRRQGRGPYREPQRHRTAGDAEAFRSGKPGR
jgi:hypothetical protein